MSGGVPAGWVLVPAIATEAMERAAFDRVRPYHDLGNQWQMVMPKDLFRLAWPAMLAATPPIEGRDADVERAMVTLDVFLAAYGNLPDKSLARPNADDNLLTWGDLRTILAALQALGERG